MSAIYNRALTAAEVAGLASNGPVKADLMVTRTDSVTTVYSGLSTVTYNIQVTNLGPSNVAAATVIDTVSSKLTGVTWTCTASSGSSCPASGSGSINHQISLESGDSAFYTLQGTVAASATGTLSNTVTVGAAGVNDPVPGNNSATDVDTIEQAVAPTISVQPANATVTQPNSATFSVTASGKRPCRTSGAATVSRFWRHQLVVRAQSDFAATDNGAQYTVVVSNIAGNVTSASATLTVNVTPSITTQPASTTVTAPLGDLQRRRGWHRATQLSMAAQRRRTSAARRRELRPEPDSGHRQRRAVQRRRHQRRRLGHELERTLTVNVPPSITTQPANVTVTAPSAATFSVVARTTPLSYQWRRNGVEHQRRHESVVRAESDGRIRQRRSVQRCRHQRGRDVTSATATLTVNPGSSAPTHHDPASQHNGDRTCRGHILGGGAGNAPLSYQWRRNGVDISGATSASYVAQPDGRDRQRRAVQRRRLERSRQRDERERHATVKAGGGGPIGPIFDVHFDTDADGFTYLDDPFRGTNQPNYASGNYIASGGFTGGGPASPDRRNQQPEHLNMSGGWRRSFTLAQPDAADAVVPASPDRAAHVRNGRVQSDARQPGQRPVWHRAQRLHRAGGRRRADTTGWQLVQINLGTIAAGTHVLTLGGYNNQKRYPDEFVEILFDECVDRRCGRAAEHHDAAGESHGYAAERCKLLGGRNGDARSAISGGATA